MNFSLPNIYHNRNLKVYIAIPIVLMIISIYLSQGLVLDSSLAGGESITLQTNTSLSASQIAAGLTQKLHVTSPSVQVSSGEVLITLSANTSLSNAEDYLIAAYAYHSNYTSALVNSTNYRISLSRNQSNTTLVSLLQQSTMLENSSVVGETKYVNLEVDALQPFNPAAINMSNPDVMITGAQSIYTNASNSYESGLISAISSVVPFSSYSYQQITVIQSSYFLQQLETIIIVAFILISIIVFFIFRSVVPSFAVVFGAANDMIIALGAMALFHIPLGIASIGGLLMLLGYAIDTDVLTAIRIIKRHEGTAEERAYGSMKTGLTMTCTAIVSFGVLFIISLILYVPTYYEIAGVVLFGLIGDIFTTWFGNASLILMYVKKKEGR